MPFNSETGRDGGKKGGGKRWKYKDPATIRSEKFLVKVTPSELAMIDAKAAEIGIPRVELIVRAVKEYKS
ncbi:MAG: hypothetical protein FWD01_03365 [Defluviitaleaceae bacterium]|nr:hypothetical protein [Defluviitaleaceae bacterium]